MTRPVDTEFAFGFGYGQKYPADLAHLTLDGKHHGQDILTPIGSLLYSPIDATLNEFGQSKTAPVSYYGLYIIAKFTRLEGLFKSQYRYICMHLSRTFLKRLKIGDLIRQDQPLGETGDTGSAAGHPHLHFETQKLVKGVWVHCDPSFLIGKS